MLFKYDKKALSKEIKKLNSIEFTKIIKNDQKSQCLEIILYSCESKYEIIFYMDISPSNNYFQKKNSKIIKTGLFDSNKLNSLISSFSESYIPEQHNQLKDFFFFLLFFVLISFNFCKNSEKLIGGIVSSKQLQLDWILFLFSKFLNCNIIKSFIIQLKQEI